MAIEFFSFWVEDIWGSTLLAYFATAFLFSIIGVLGKMSYFLLFSMIGLYIVVFGIGFYGIIFWLPIFLFSMIYFFMQLYNFIQRD